MATDYTWKFDTERSDGGIIVDRIQTDMPEYSPGKKITLQCEFWPGNQEFASEQGGTYGNSTGFTFGGSTGAIYGSTKMITDHIDRYLEARKYAEYVGRGTTNRAIDGQARFTERLPSGSGASVDSIVIPLEPGEGLKDEATDGLWVFLDAAEDTTELIQNLARIEFRAIVLAKLSDYGSRTQIRNELED